MGARRLIIVLLVMLALSTIAAALVPAPRRGSSSETTASGTHTATAPPPPTGRLLRAVLDAGAARQGTIHARLGDELRLEVRGRGFGEVEIAGYGLVEPVSRETPAEFDALLDRRGSFAVRLVGVRRVGSIAVGPQRSGTGTGNGTGTGPS